MRRRGRRAGERGRGSGREAVGGRAGQRESGKEKEKFPPSPAIQLVKLDGLGSKL